MGESASSGACITALCPTCRTLVPLFCHFSSFFAYNECTIKRAKTNLQILYSHIFDRIMRGKGVVL
jgi:hypothetical protein